MTASKRLFSRLLSHLCFGLVLALLLNAGLMIGERQITHAPGWLILFALGSVILGLVINRLAFSTKHPLIRNSPQLFKLSFLFFVHPVVISVSVLGGLLFFRLIYLPREDLLLMFLMMLGGIALGALFAALSQRQKKQSRLFLLLICIATLAAILCASLFLLSDNTTVIINNHELLGLFLLIGLPYVVLLAIVGESEEPEWQIIACCALLFLALLELTHSMRALRATTFLLPMMIYLWWSYSAKRMVLTYKYVLQSMAFSIRGQDLESLRAIDRARRTDPNDEHVLDLYWEIISRLSTDQLQESLLTQVVQPTAQLTRIQALAQVQSPSADQISQAHRLLDILSDVRPDLEGAIRYWRAFLFIREQRSEEAQERIRPLLEKTATFPRTEALQAQSWHLTLLSGDSLLHSLGSSLLSEPQERLRVIALVERYLKSSPEEQANQELKNILYQRMNDNDFTLLFSLHHPLQHFDYREMNRIGQSLGSSASWEKGCLFLEIAAHGLHSIAPSLMLQIARKHEQNHDAASQWEYYNKCKWYGAQLKLQQLDPQARQDFFAVVRTLAQRAMEKGDLDSAIDNYQWFARNDESGIETRRILASLYEQKAEQDSRAILDAVRWTEAGLAFNSKDRDLLQRKERYYYSINVDDLQSHRNEYQSSLDIDYCIKKASSLLEANDISEDNLNWADQLLSVAWAVADSERKKSIQISLAQIYLTRSRQRGTDQQELSKTVQMLTPLKDQLKDQRLQYQCLSLLGQAHLQLGHLDEALSDFHACAKLSESGIETRRILADLYQKKAEAGESRFLLDALRWTEAGLVLNKKDADLLQRKEEYYYSIQPEDLRQRKKEFALCIDIDYCKTKAEELLKPGDETTSENLAWASHLMDVALAVADEKQLSALRLIQARIYLHLARQQAQDSSAYQEQLRQTESILRDIYRSTKPGSLFRPADEWFEACWKLGELYLDYLGKPEEAVAPLEQYEKGPRAGARASFKLGQAYEQSGESTKAIRCYRTAAVYNESNPWVAEAKNALQRLGVEI